MFGDWNLALAALQRRRGTRQPRDGALRARATSGRCAETSDLAAGDAQLRAHDPRRHHGGQGRREVRLRRRARAALIFDAVPVKGAVDLRVIAECAGTGREHRADAEPRAAAAGHAREPHLRGEGARRARGSDARAAAWTTLPAEKRVAFRTHVVGRGQTPGRPSPALRRAGRATSRPPTASAPASALARGTELIIPVKARPPRAATLGRAATRTAVPPPASAAGRHPARASPQRYNTTVADLMSWNNLTRHAARRRQHPHHLHHSLAAGPAPGRRSALALRRRTRALPPHVGGRFRPREIPCWPRR